MRRLRCSPSMLLLLAAVVLSVGGCPSPPSGATLRGETMGTSYLVRIGLLPDGVTAKDLKTQIEVRLAVVNAQMSTWDRGSELSRFNASDSIDWFDVSRATVFVTETALEIHTKSEGAFDPTVGPLVDLWGFGPQPPGEFPTDAEVKRALEQIGFEAVSVRKDEWALKKSRPGIELNYSAIAKGYGVDVVAEILEINGVESYLIEIGGEVRTKGPKPNGQPWTIGLVTPDPNFMRQEIERTVDLETIAIATSGDYRNYRTDEDGTRYAHAIDPRTGKPVTHRLASVTVAHPECMMADAWATALLVLGEEEGFRIARKYDLAAYFLYRVDDDFEEKATPQFTKQFGSESPLR